VQGSRVWQPPSGTLGQLTAAAGERAAALERRRADLKALAADVPPGTSLAAALRRDDVAVIAEIKRRSPSKGDISPGASATALGAAYADGGAAALSILTEPEQFGGDASDLVDVRRRINLPTLKKDFHVDSIQLLEARAIGASALLLIARALEPARLDDLAREAALLGVEVLIEVRDDDELARAVATGAPMIGVNNRNLETLVITPSTAVRLVPLIPADRVAIYESGIKGADDVARAALLGADAVLVGSSVAGAADPAGAVRALTGVARQGRRAG
jgi:indole-3-glycerol phosphate synthase